MKKLFSVTNIVKNSDKEKYMYSGYGISFDGTGEGNFGNEFARNVVIFGVDNSSSSHTDNFKNDFLVFGEGDVLVLVEALVHQKKSLVLTLLRQRQNFV